MKHDQGILTKPWFTSRFGVYSQLCSDSTFLPHHCRGGWSTPGMCFTSFWSLLKLDGERPSMPAVLSTGVFPLQCLRYSASPNCCCFHVDDSRSCKITGYLPWDSLISTLSQYSLILAASSMPNHVDFRCIGCSGSCKCAPKLEGAEETLPNTWDRYQVFWEWVFCAEHGKDDAKGWQDWFWDWRTLRSGILNQGCVVTGLITMSTAL